ncbi:Phage repressor protein C, contains Cro/C1-type HTH and peptisase s24 domains [Pseudomonas linyingensis]|uniref:Phage repressor protein C, contains Cro/C1-type HTH and peptisase s24 domains n=2 Tax=Pseudomonas linyingensis TaxID=915471 RepID=A0A1H7A0H9_9PSED|nr:Phage repressor protein C, contains Cro/C1-type HTH and peptisase s24 domains [Pseudomonas linyingensis]
MLATKAGKALSQEARARLIVAAQEEAEQAPAKHSGNVLTGNFNLSARVVEGDILIPQYDVRASMGHGQMPAEYAEFVRNVVVSGPQLEKLGLEFTSPANLSIITGWGQSMEGTINDKDPVIVDRGVNEFAGDGIYVLTWNDMLYIKRLQMADADNFELISDNQKHKDRTVPIGDVTIHARVLFVWNGKKL